MTRARLLSLALAAGLLAACGGSSTLTAPGPPEAGVGGATADASVPDAGSGAPEVCTPGAVLGCYDGPAATEGVGPCHGGTKTCKADGSGFGPCTGEVLPKTEDCSTPIDEDCDGHTTCGQLLWTKTFGDGTEQPPNAAGSYLGGATATGVAVGAQGDILVTGNFFGSADFGNGPLKAGPALAVFVVKLDPSGADVWNEAFPVAQGDTWGVAVDSQRNVIVSGYFSGSIDFGLGPLDGGTGSVFVVKFDADGKALWNHNYGPTSSWAPALAIDSHDDIVLGSELVGSIDFGGGPIGSGDAGSIAGYVAKLGPDGNLLWSRESSSICYSVAVAPGDDIIATGSGLMRLDASGATLWSEDLPSTPDMTLGSASAAVGSNGDILGAGTMSYGYGSAEFKLDAQGNTIWKLDDGGGYDESTGATAVDRMDNLVVLGSHEWGGYIEKLSGVDGAGIWSRSFGTSGNSYGAEANAVAITPDNNIVVVGDFTQADFGGGPLPHAGTAPNGFIVELGP